MMSWFILEGGGEPLFYTLSIAYPAFYALFRFGGESHFVILCKIDSCSQWLGNHFDRKSYPRVYSCGKLNVVK